MVELYADGAGLAQMRAYAADKRIAGFTTNPSLMRKAGITQYRSFAEAVLKAVGEKPVSFEVLADDWATMEAQAREIASWGENVYVKIPITNTKGESSAELIRSLGSMNLNITAVMTVAQYEAVKPHLLWHHILSVFAGRIMDTGEDVPIIHNAPCRVLWASTRQVYSIRDADVMGYDIITLTPDLIAKLDLSGKDLTAYSLETVRQFHEDGKGIEF